MQRMRVLLFGLYGHGLASLQQLLESRFDVVGYVTKADNQEPAIALARSHDVTVFQPRSVSRGDFAQDVGRLAPDLIAVSGFHQVIPRPVLDLPSLGAINVHGSLLPRYRGPNPHKWAIINGESLTGVTVHRMTPGLDDGDILEQRTVRIAADDTSATLFDKLSIAGARLLVDTIEKIHTGTARSRPQDPRDATYHSYPTEAETQISWSADAVSIRNLVRGLNPRPGAWTRLEGDTIRVWALTITAETSSALPGTIVKFAGRPVVATATRNVVLDDFSADADLPPHAQAAGQRVWTGRRFG
jgi:methionyl-tRNA formyltransferase